MVRLKSATTTLPTGRRVQDLRYEYDPVGNINAMRSLLPDPGPGSQLPGGGDWSFAYDGVNRLTSAAGYNALAPNKTTSYSQNFEYSLSHNLLRKSRVHSIAPSSGTPTYPPHTNIDYRYAYNERPHAPSEAGDLILKYDPSGNMIERQKKGSGATAKLSWDDDGHLIQVQGQGAFQRNY